MRLTKELSGPSVVWVARTVSIFLFKNQLYGTSYKPHHRPILTISPHGILILSSSRHDCRTFTRPISFCLLTRLGVLSPDELTKLDKEYPVSCTMAPCTKCGKAEADAPWQSCARCNMLRRHAYWHRAHPPVEHVQFYWTGCFVVPFTVWLSPTPPWELVGD